MCDRQLARIADLAAASMRDAVIMPQCGVSQTHNVTERYSGDVRPQLWEAQRLARLLRGGGNVGLHPTFDRTD